MTMEHGLYLGTRSRTRPDTRKAMVGALKAGLIVMAVFADRIAPYSYDESVPGSRKKPPSVRFMGTDNIGRDMWSRAVRHARRLSTAGRRQDSQPLGPIRPTTERDGVQGRAASGLTGRARAWRTGWAGSGRPPDMAMVQAPDFANLHDHAALRSLDWPTVGIFVEREVSSRPMIST